jgi:hypothetical protein
MVMKIDPTISWGDIGMGIGLLFTGILAFTGLSEQVALQEERISSTAQATRATYEALETHKAESASRDLAIRAELRAELRDINNKLDRLVERIPANGH